MAAAISSYTKRVSCQRHEYERAKAADTSLSEGVVLRARRVGAPKDEFAHCFAEDWKVSSSARVCGTSILHSSVKHGPDERRSCIYERLDMTLTSRRPLYSSR